MKRLVLSAFVIIFLFWGFLPLTGNAAEKVITLRFAHFVPSNNIEGQLMQQWANEVEKRTNGRVKVTIYPGSTVLGMDQMYDGITKEIADIGYGNFSAYRGRFLLTEVIDLPLGYKNFSTDTRLANAYYKKFRPKELDDVKVLFLQGLAPGLLHSVKPISRLEDVKGRKIRALGVSGRIVTALGGAPVGIPMVDTYDALSKGIVEGVLINWGGAFNYKMGEVTKNHLIAPAIGYGTNLYIVMNKDKWNSLPPDIQAIIDKFDEEWINWLPQKWGGEWDANGKAGIEKMGNKVTTLSKEENDRWALLMKPIFDDYVKAAKAKGLPGDEALKFCVDYLKANDK